MIFDLFCILMLTLSSTVQNSNSEHLIIVDFTGSEISIPCTADVAIPVWTKNLKSLNSVTTKGRNLILPNAQGSDSGVYGCSSSAVEAQVFIGGADDTKIDLRKPRMFLNEQKIITCKGNSVTWIKVSHDHNTIVSRNTVLNIRGARREDDGRYYCHGISDGEYFIDGVTVRVYDPNIIEPTIRKLAPGETGGFWCNLPNVLEWTHNSGPLPDNAKLDMNGQIIVLEQVSNQQEGWYECLGFNSNNERTRTIAQLIVTEDSTDSPSFEVKTQLAYKGDDVVLVCESTSTPIWSKVSFSKTILSKSKNLTLENVQESSSGHYTCRENLKLEVLLLVGVFDHPRITPREIKVDAGTSTVLVCNASGKVSWYTYYDNTFTETSLNNHWTVNTDGFPSLLKIFCIGMESTYFFLDHIRLFTYDEHKISQTVLRPYIGDTIEISCKSFSRTNWKFNDSTLPNNVYVTGHNLETLLILNVEMLNEGYYECEGTDSTNNPFYSKAVLQVLKDTYTFGASVTHYLAYYDDILLLQCKSTNQPQWRKNGVEINDTSITLVLANVNEEHNGYYSCYRNIIEFKVYVGDNANSLGVIESRDVAVEEGMSTSMTCLLSNPKWFHKGKNYLISYLSDQNILKINNIDIHSTGKYFCHGWNNDRGSSMLAETNLHIYDNSRMIPNGGILIAEGQDAYLHCESVIPVEWSFNNKILPHNAFINDDRSRTVLLKAVTLENTGYYQCKGRQLNDEDIYYARKEVTVIGKSRDSTPDSELSESSEFNEGGVFPQEIMALMGERVEFLCMSSHDVDWLFNDQALPNNIHLENKPQSEEHWLKIPSVEPHHDGIYSCHQSVPGTHPGPLIGNAILIVQVLCPKLYVKNGKIFLKRVKQGDIAYYTCDSGSPNGDMVRHCQPDGTWSGQDITCPDISKESQQMMKKLYLLYSIILSNTFIT